MNTTTAIGSAGEAAVAQWYSARGYEILARNWRAPRSYGGNEIDIIAQREQTIVFCEVKTRRSRVHGGGEEAVDPRKQSKIRRAARAWLHKAEQYYAQIRFDVIVVDGRGRLQVYAGAF